MSQFDVVFLLAIYPTRLQPIEGVTSQWLLDKTTNTKKQLVSKNSLPAIIKNSDCRIKLLVGAGDIGVEVHTITKYLLDEA